MKVRKRRRPPPESRCAVKGCTRTGVVTMAGVCFLHWIRVPIRFRFPVWNSDPGTEERREAVAAVVKSIELDEEAPLL